MNGNLVVPELLDGIVETAVDQFVCGDRGAVPATTIVTYGGDRVLRTRLAITPSSDQ
ncbi:hypothetical protein GCM10012289_05010 [Nonomuraea cavernae]|uniref:Uncharacterized protein n=1 Tax=Nonomuraea cavernae TaxID=2045107 RepID=A0A917YRN0_9ACTN|nr:hypothetical protein GCM10012289_05010 [Nonomuraea cavernae]